MRTSSLSHFCLKLKKSIRLAQNSNDGCHISSPGFSKCKGCAISGLRWTHWRNRVKSNGCSQGHRDRLVSSRVNPGDQTLISSIFFHSSDILAFTQNNKYFFTCEVIAGNTSLVCPFFLISLHIEWLILQLYLFIFLWLGQVSFLMADFILKQEFCLFPLLNQKQPPVFLKCCMI